MTKVLDQVPSDLEREQLHHLKVYMSPKDRKSILGYLTGPAIIDAARKQATWLTTPFGVPVEKAYKLAVETVSNAGIRFLLIDDPEGLFPPNTRPKI